MGRFYLWYLYIFLPGTANANSFYPGKFKTPATICLYRCHLPSPGYFKLALAGKKDADAKRENKLVFKLDTVAFYYNSF